MDHIDENEAIDHLRELINRLDDTQLKVVLLCVVGAFTADDFSRESLYVIVKAYARSEVARINGMRN